MNAMGLIRCNSIVQWASFRRTVTIRSSAFYFSTISTNDENNTKATTVPLKSKYFVPRKERKDPGCYSNYGEFSYDGRLVRTKRTSPTRELNYGVAQWKQHKNVYRRLRHMRTLFRSSPFQRLLFPDLAILSAVSIGLAVYNEVNVANPIVMECGYSFSGATTAIGLLVAFRLNGSYGRYDEARKFWGEINNASRDLAGNALMWIQDSRDKARMIRFIKAYPVGVHWNLNDKGGHYRYKRAEPNFEEQLYAEFFVEMKDIFESEKDPDFQRICQAYQAKQHVPLTIASGMRSIIAANTKADSIYNREMDEQVQRLVGCVGMCERVLRTPIPTCFTRHSSRLFFLWSNLLPFAIYPTLGPIATLPASLILSYSVLAVGDIAVQLEEPFNVLPLRQYSEGIYSGVNDIQKSYEDSVSNRIDAKVPTK